MYMAICYQWLISSDFQCLLNWLEGMEQSNASPLTKGVDVARWKFSWIMIGGKPKSLEKHFHVYFLLFLVNLYLVS